MIPQVKRLSGLWHAGRLEGQPLGTFEADRKQNLGGISTHVWFLRGPRSCALSSRQPRSALSARQVGRGVGDRPALFPRGKLHRIANQVPDCVARARSVRTSASIFSWMSGKTVPIHGDQRGIEAIVPVTWNRQIDRVTRGRNRLGARAVTTIARSASPLANGNSIHANSLAASQAFCCPTGIGEACASMHLPASRRARRSTRSIRTTAACPS